MEQKTSASGAAAQAAAYPVELLVGPRYRDLVGFEINRVWPTPRRRLIGPFVFFDHMLAVELDAGRGLDVPPHPHIGLSTVTYLFEGELVHRDSLGVEQLISPGDLNWMTAGRGIVHSERSSDAERASASRLHGIQAWVALPAAFESEPPSFDHYSGSEIPQVSLGGVELTVIAGSAFGQTSPAETHSELFYAEARMPRGTRLEIDPALGERAAYVVAGAVTLRGQSYEAGRLFVFANGSEVSIEAATDAHLMLLGGAPLDGERHVWWNFVSSSADAIERAKRDWREGRFPKVPGDDGYMPLP